MATYLERTPEAGLEEVAARNVAALQESKRNEPASIVARLQASLPKGTAVEGSFKTGGVVPKTGAYKLEKGETVISTQPDSTQAAPDALAAKAAAQSAAPQPDAQTPPAQESSTPDSGDENAVAGTTNLHRAFSKLNEAITKLFDSLGVKRSLTLPHQDGQSMDQHIADVGRALSTTGGLTANLLTAGHSKYGSAETVAHPAQKLRETIIPKDNPEAIAAISACRSFVNKCAALIGDEEPAVKLAKGQLSIVGKSEGEGMTASDLGVALLNIPGPVIQAVARQHSGTKEGGHAPHLRAPRA